MNLQDLTAFELLQINQLSLDELERRNILKIRNNPLHDYTNWLVNNKMNMKPISSNSEGYDLKTSDGRKVMIIAKRNLLNNNSTMLGVISEKLLKNIDETIAVIYHKDLSIQSAVIIPSGVIYKLGVYNHLQKAYAIRVDTKLVCDPNVVDVKLLLCEHSNCDVTDDSKIFESTIRDLRVVGKKTFVKYYQHYALNIDVNEIIQIMLSENVSWKEMTARKKAKKMQSIFKKNDNFKSLKMIINSKSILIPEPLKDQARNLLEEFGQKST
ncbi:hypothetical protein J1779_00665 [Rahnella sp. FC061912-K]|uniref:hypothetical protein n=1 Tax=Rahnella rivi TaxID=2816249 RepID=UPI001C255FAC|nr:hypothetical protein [Rahnella rivi]MBU9828449.1 hypothetical protein [Rahnella rivi]